MKNITLILDNIRSTHNAGSIFRTADGAGVSKIYLCGYTPAPVDRFGRKRSDISKVSLGAEENIEWESKENTLDLIKELKNEGYRVVALEQSDKAVDYKDFKKEEKVALVVGNEVDGLSEDILKACDKVIEIPMLGKKESLNVSVATGIALYSLI